VVTGQSSGRTATVAFTVVALAQTGSDTQSLLVLGLGLLVGGTGLMLTVRRRSAD